MRGVRAVVLSVERGSVVQVVDLRERPRRVRVPVHPDPVHAAVVSQLIVLEEKQRVKKSKHTQYWQNEKKGVARG